jgi:hypothetical protein
MSFIDRYSYIIVSLVLLVAGGFIAYASPTNTALYGLITFLVGAFLVLYWVIARRGALTPVNPGKRIRRGRSSERPVVVHFYHDYSLGSLFNRMFTWKAERDCKGHADFIYIDAAHRDAAPVLEELEAEVGAWVLFDAAGNFVEKVDRISVGKIEELRHRPVH